jgi:hypothetical protein
MRLSYDVSVGGATLGRVCLLLKHDFEPALQRGEAYAVLWGAPTRHDGLAERLLFELPARAHVVYGSSVLSAVAGSGRGEVARVYNIEVLLT